VGANTTLELLIACGPAAREGITRADLLRAASGERAQCW
jgi:hypothetical protein